MLFVNPNVRIILLIMKKHKYLVKSNMEQEKKSINYFCLYVIYSFFE